MLFTIQFIVDCNIFILEALILSTSYAADDPGLVANVLSLLLNISSLGPDILPMYPDALYSTPENGEKYDFIIVGAGPTGSVLANRLSGNESWKILLLEAGIETENIITDIPIICGYMEFTDYNWGYQTEPQEEFCRGCINKRMEWPHGKTLGGGTNINYMIYVRGNHHDFDRWAGMGNPGWSYDEVLPYFLKLENDKIAISDDGYHSSEGPLSVTDIPYRTGVVDAYVRGAQEAGYNYVDYNGKTQIGVSYVQGTLKNGARCSAEKAYLRSARGRKNLKIFIRAQVTKILIDPNLKYAYGVEYYRNGKYYTAYATKEVILSAGSQNSPQLLMLSGVGPEEHLDELGIPVIQSLPVGKKMYDHAVFVGMQFQINESIVLNIFDIVANVGSYVDYFLFGKGVWTSLGGVEALTYFKANSSNDPDPTYPDIELMTIGGSLSTDFGVNYRRMFNVPWNIYDALWRPQEFKSVYSIFPILLHPESYGHIELRSKDPFDYPKFFANYFSDPNNRDIRRFIDAIREIQRINESPALKKLNATMIDTPMPGCENFTFNSDEYWECALRTLIGSQYHQTATCKMGPANDPESIVDSTLKVYGIGRLRVADTSVIPLSISSHSMAMGYMIGEKASDIIKQTWSH